MYNKFFRGCVLSLVISLPVFSQNTLIGIQTTADFSCHRVYKNPIIKKYPTKLIKSNEFLGGISYVNDKHGNIVLYSDGKSLWNGQGQVIGSGYDGLGGERAQTVVLTKNMKKDRVYYMFYISKNPNTNLASVNYIRYHTEMGIISPPITIATSKDVGTFLGISAVNIGHETHIAFIDFANNELIGAILDHETEELTQRHILGILPKSHFISYAHIKFSPSGRFLSVISESSMINTLQLFRYHPRKEIQEIFRSDLDLDSPYRYAEFSADESYFYTLIHKKSTDAVLARYQLSNLRRWPKLLEIPSRYKDKGTVLQGIIRPGGLQLSYNGDIYLFFKEQKYIITLNTQVSFDRSALGVLGGISSEMLNYAPNLEASMLRIPFLVNCVPEEEIDEYTFNLEDALPLYFSQANWPGANLSVVTDVKFYEDQNRLIEIENPRNYTFEGDHSVVYVNFLDELGRCYTNPRIALKKAMFKHGENLKFNFSQQDYNYKDLSSLYKRNHRSSFSRKGIKFRNYISDQQVLRFYESYDSVVILTPHIYEIQKNVSEVYVEVEGIYGCRRVDTLQLFYSNFASIQKSVKGATKEKLDIIRFSLEQNEVYGENILERFSKLVTESSLSYKSLNNKVRVIAEVILDQVVYDLLAALKNKAMPGLNNKIVLIFEKALIKLQQLNSPESYLTPTFSIESRLLELVDVVEGSSDSRDKIMQELDLKELSYLQQQEILDEREKLIVSNKGLMSKFLYEEITDYNYKKGGQSKGLIESVADIDFSKEIFGLEESLVESGDMIDPLSKALKEQNLDLLLDTQKPDPQDDDPLLEAMERLPADESIENATILSVDSFEKKPDSISTTDILPAGSFKTDPFSSDAAFGPMDLESSMHEPLPPYYNLDPIMVYSKLDKTGISDTRTYENHLRKPLKDTILLGSSSPKLQPSLLDTRSNEQKELEVEMMAIMNSLGLNLDQLGPIEGQLESYQRKVTPTSSDLYDESMEEQAVVSPVEQPSQMAPQEIKDTTYEDYLGLGVQSKVQHVERQSEEEENDIQEDYDKTESYEDYKNKNATMIPVEGLPSSGKWSYDGNQAIRSGVPAYKRLEPSQSKSRIEEQQKAKLREMLLIKLYKNLSK